MCPQFQRIFNFLYQTYDKTWIYFVYIRSSCVDIKDSSFLVTGALAWTFQLDFYFCSKILAKLTFTKLDNEMINTINHHNN